MLKYQWLLQMQMHELFPDLHDSDNLMFDTCEFLLQTLPLFFTGPYNIFHLLLQLNLQLLSGLLRPLGCTQCPFKFFKRYQKGEKKNQDTHQQHIQKCFFFLTSIFWSGFHSPDFSAFSFCSCSSSFWAVACWSLERSCAISSSFISSVSCIWRFVSAMTIP